eukprot:EG_transcript_43498
MPKHFVPVSDPERPRSEQVNDPALQKHRQFDRLSQPYDTLPEDERAPKDRVAQVPRVTAAHGMVRNEKGLWVKAPKAAEKKEKKRPRSPEPEEKGPSAARSSQAEKHSDPPCDAGPKPSKEERERAALDRLAALRAKQSRR